jgi:hypothetical protein
MSAALQLYITTKDEQYAKVFKDAVWQSLDRFIQFGIRTCATSCALYG